MVSSSNPEKDIKCAIPGGLDRMLVNLTGAIVTWWGRIEGVLIFDLILLRQHPACRVLSEKEKFPIPTGEIVSQWDRARRLVFSENERKLGEQDELLLQLKECSEERNILVHYFWPWGGSDNDVSSRSLTLQSIQRTKGTRDTLSFKTVKIDIFTLDRLNDKLSSLYIRVMISNMQLMIGPDRIKSYSEDSCSLTPPAPTP